MPTNKRSASQKGSSVMVSTRVVESYSSMTSLKTVSHRRTSSGKMLETWSSPSLALTSPLSWVSGSQAKFLSPPKSPSPKLRITRRSSIYVKQQGAGKSRPKSSAKGIIEFKIPTLSIKDTTAAGNKRSSINRKGRQESSVSRRSSLYRKGTKSLAIVEIEKSESVSPKENMSKKLSLKAKKSKLPSPSAKQVKSPVSTTRSRKRNVSEIEKEESPAKPAAKRRRRQASDLSLNVSPKRGRKVSSKSPVKETKPTKTENVVSPSSTRQAGRKAAKKAVRSATKKKSAKSASPHKTRTTRSLQSKTPSPVQKKKKTRAKRGAVDDDEDNDEREDSKTADDFTPVGSNKTSKAQTSVQRKRKAVDDTSKDTPERKLSKSSSKSKGKKARSSSKTSSTKKSGGSRSARKSASSASSASKSLLFESKQLDKKTQNKRGSPKKTAETPKSASKSKRKSVEKDTFGMNKMSSQRTKVEESADGFVSLSKSAKSTPKRKPKTPKTPKSKSDTPKSSTKKLRSEVRSPRGKLTTDVKTPRKTDSANTDTAKKAATPKSGPKPRKQPQSTGSTKKSSAIRSASKSGKKTTETSVSSDVLDGSYVQVSVQHLKMNSSSSRSPAVSKKATSSRSKGVRSVEDERIMEILRKAVKTTPKPGMTSTPKSLKKTSTPKFSKGTSTPKPLKKPSTPKSSKRTATPASPNGKKQSASATPKRLQSAQRSAKSTPKSQKTSKTVVTPKNVKLSQKSISSSVSKATTQTTRKTPRIVITDESTPKSAARKELARKHLSPQNQSQQTSSSRTTSAFFSRDLQDLSSGKRQLGRASLSLQSEDGRLQALSLRSRTPVQDQAFHEEKTFSQYVERRASRGVERYGGRAVEHTDGGETYRAGGYVIQREKGADMTREEEEWEEGNINNSALSIGDVNTTVSTSTYSNRCTIL